MSICNKNDNYNDNSNDNINVEENNINKNDEENNSTLEEIQTWDELNINSRRRKYWKRFYS
jgi:hypothetical protein